MKIDIHTTKHLIIVLLVTCLYTNKIMAQVGVNTNSPDKSAALDIKSSNKGLLPPKINLISTTDVASINGGNPAQGLLVYNTNTTISGTGADGIGYYCWDTVIWKKLVTKGSTPVASSWSLDGNEGIDDSLNFLGTLDNNEVIIKTNNKERVRLTTKSTNKNTGAVGIGVTDPDHKLDVNAADIGINFKNLPTTSNGVSTNMLLIDADGELSLSSYTNKVGELLRYGINDVTIVPGESALRSSSYLTNKAMGNAPNGGANFINTLTGGSISTITQPVGVGVPARTTEAIALEAGTYKLTIRLIGKFSTPSKENKVDLKIITNNLVSSLGTGVISFSGAGNYSGIYTEIITINKSSTIDFTVSVINSDFVVNSYDTPPAGSGKSYRSLIFLERLN